MRTTITLDDDIAAAIDEEVRRRPRASFKAVVNELLRTGLKYRQQAEAAPKFTVRAHAVRTVETLGTGWR
jgi:Arc/MetJ-type ribon-helix-helix transcriptional regulator